MGTTTTAVGQDAALRTFAQLLQQGIGAERVLLYGSRARNQAHDESDLDIIIISRSFNGVEFLRRSIGLRKHWYQADGDGSMDLVCLTPEEFEDARHRPTLIAAVLPEAIDLLPAP